VEIWNFPQFIGSSNKKGRRNKATALVTSLANDQIEFK
jgi:hypothetical protein